MPAPLLPAAAVALGAEILSGMLKIGSSEEGLAWIGRRLHDKMPAIRARIKANRKVKVGGKLPGA